MTARINDRYEVRRCLGSGAQGMVLEVEDSSFPTRPTALKIISGAAPDALLLFEFEQLTRLEHPHLVRVHDLGRVTSIDGAPPEGGEIRAGAVFFTQDLVDGEPCGEFLERLPEKDRPLAAIGVCIATARALALIHERGLVHRDVKPSNILVSTDGREIKLIDFGLSRLVGVPDGLRAGTLGFIAPEALQGYPDRRSDLYGLGATLGFLLTGRTPRPGVGYEEESLPGGKAAKVPAFDGAFRVARRLTRARPEERYQTAGEAILALGRIAPEVMDEEGERPIDAAGEPEDRRGREVRFLAADLIGREEEVRRGAAWIEAALTGAGPAGVLVVHGPRGAGRTRVIRASVVRAQLRIAAGGGVPPSCLSGSLRELVIALRLGTRTDASGTDRPRLAAWLGDATAGAAGEGQREGLVADIAAVLGAAARPVVLVVERVAGDLEEEVLGRLAEGLEAGVAVIVEIGDEAAVGGPLRTAGIEALRLAPLAPAAEAALVRSMMDRDPGEELCRRLYRLTGGLPGLTGRVMAFLCAKSPSGRPEAGDLADLEAAGLPGVVPARWLTPRLSPPARRMATALAVLEGAADLSLALEVAGFAAERERQGLEGLGELERLGLVSIDDAGRARLFGLAARELGESLSKRAARDLHRRALAALGRRPDREAERLARHALGAGRKAEARELLRRAADLMVRAGDFGGAIRALDEWLELPGGERSEIIRAKLEAARLARRIGRYDLAAARLDSLDDDSLGEHAAWAVLERASLLRLTGKPEAAREIMGEAGSGRGWIALERRALAGRLALDAGDVEGAARAVGSTANLPEPDSTRAGLTGVAGLLELMRGDQTAAKRLLSAGLAAAEADGDALQRARFESLLGMAAHRRGDFPEAAARYRAALDLAESIGDVHGRATYAANLAAALTELDDIAGALETYRQGLALLERVGRAAELARAGANYAELLLRVGDTAAALDASRRALESARDCGDGAVLLAAACVRGETLVVAGDPTRAREVLERAAEEGGRAPDAGMRIVLDRHLAAAALALGAPEKARRVLQRTAPEDRCLEHARLSCEVALAEGAVPPPVLEDLLGRLPGPGEPRGSLHLGPLFIAARAAATAGERPLARQLAREALALLSRVRHLTPSLHRPEEDPMKRELEELAGEEGHGAPGSGAVGDEWAWERLARINTRLNSEQRVGALLDLIMDTAVEITGAERGFLLVRDRQGRPRVRCARNIDRDRLAADEQDYSHSVALAAFTTGEPVITTDAQADSRFRDFRSVLSLDLRYVLAVPLVVRGRRGGAIYVDSRSGARFDERRLALVRALADQAAIALENARLTAELRRRQRRIEKQSRQLEQKLEQRELELERIRRDLERRIAEPSERYGRQGIVGRSAPMERVFGLIDRAAATDLPVVITGESGTGKELAARAIHAGGTRRAGPFVAESCAAIPGTLLESVLFGHVRGAFTGAVRDNPGLFVEADGGTLFLDELGDLPPALQAKLLRVLQEGELRPVGGSRVVRVDVRILAAAGADLEELLRTGRLREDLFYRLDVIRLRLPPLRERREDIPLLAAHFAAKHGGAPPPRLTGAAIAALSAGSWPGNVRQLENEMLRALITAEGEIDLGHLSDELIGAAAPGRWDDGDDLRLEPRLDDLKARLIAAALERSGGNRTRAAALLGVSRFGLQKMLARLGE